jgi:hypothetical protein
MLSAELAAQHAAAYETTFGRCRGPHKPAFPTLLFILLIIFGTLQPLRYLLCSFRHPATNNVVLRLQHRHITSARLYARGQGHLPHRMPPCGDC